MEKFFISWNVNGIRAVARKGKGFLNYLYYFNPDVLCVQETKARPEQLDDELINPVGYYTYWNYPAEKKGYSGVAIFTREKPEKVLLGIGIKEYDDEGRILIAEYSKYTLFNIYFPKGDVGARIDRLHYKLAFYDAFLEYIDAYYNKQPNIIICGDLNTAHKPIDLARPKENEKLRVFYQKKEHGLINLLNMDILTPLENLMINQVSTLGGI